MHTVHTWPSEPWHTHCDTHKTHWVNNVISRKSDGVHKYSLICSKHPCVVTAPGLVIHHTSVHLIRPSNRPIPNESALCVYTPQIWSDDLLYISPRTSLPNSISFFIDTDTVYWGDYILWYKSNNLSWSEPGAGQSGLQRETPAYIWVSTSARPVCLRLYALRLRLCCVFSFSEWHLGECSRVPAVQ